MVLDAASGSPRPSAIACASEAKVRRPRQVGCLGSAGRDDGVRVAGGDHGMQLAKQRGGERGLGHSRGELVVLAAGRCRYRVA